MTTIDNSKVGYVRLAASYVLYIAHCANSYCIPGSVLVNTIASACKYTYFVCKYIHIDV